MPTLHMYTLNVGRFIALIFPNKHFVECTISSGLKTKQKQSLAIIFALTIDKNESCTVSFETNRDMT